MTNQARDDGDKRTRDDGLSLRLVVILLLCALVGTLVVIRPVLAVPLVVAVSVFYLLDRLITKDR